MRRNVVKIALIAMLMLFVGSGSVIMAKEQKSKRESNSTKKRIVVSPSRVVYKKTTPVVKAVRRVPSSAVVVKHNGINIHFHNGLFYRKEPDRYISIVAPIGLRISVLPVGYSLLRLIDRDYYYYEGTYYQEANNGYEVVEAPDDIIVSTLPEEAEQITVDGKEYYLYNGNLYSIVITPDGKAFKMSGQIEFE